MTKTFFLFLILSLFSLNTYATVWYVSTNATGLNDGTSWLNAYTDLQYAIASSSFGDEIWVASGTYKPTSTTTRSIYFSIKNGTAVYGGFNGTETMLSERNSELNVTVLSGEIGTGSATDNSYKVVYFSNVGNQTKIAGFTILGGYNNGSGDGGGIYSTNSSPVIQNCKIVGNYAEVGGGLCHGGSGNITITDCLFDGNQSLTQGGAINVYTGTNNIISNCYIKSNQSNIGGGVSIASSSLAGVNIENTTIAGNTSNSNGSAIYFNNGAKINLYNSLIVGNYAGSGGVIRTETFSNSNTSNIINCTIANNGQADSGSSSRSILLNDDCYIANSIVYGNTGVGQILAIITVDNSIVQTGGPALTGSNIISSNPNFILPGNATSAPFDTTGINYKVGNFSPAIDFGLNASVVGTTDVDGNNRIHNTIVDLGAYEADFCISPFAINAEPSTVICGGTPIILTVNQGENFQWSTNSVDDTLTISSAGTYSVIFEDTSGCRGTDQVTVTSSAVPTPTITFSGGNLTTGSFSSYQWYFNGDTIVGATTGSHTPLEGYGMYAVDVTNSSGCSASTTYCFSPATLTASGPVDFCQGDSVTLTASNGDNFVWSTGSINSEITVTTSGTYSVTVLNSSAGCSVNLQQVVTVTNNPTPTISISSGNLTTQSYSSYQWSFNGTPISGATSQTIDPTSTGNGQYTVVVINASGCEGTSSTFILNNVGIENKTLSEFLIYPNPVRGNESLNFSWKQVSSEKSIIKIYDIAGSVVLQVESENLPTSIVLPNLQSGMYFITVETNSIKTEKQKIVVR